MDLPMDGSCGRAAGSADTRREPGDWEPFWIGPPSRLLYAALHAGTASSATGVLFVPPLFDELPRSRRFVTEVAGELAAAGLPVLRFDFLGSGDSSGRGDEASFESMRTDLDLAVAALRARTGASRVVVLAWRGAALVVDDWLAHGGRADHVVWWDPLRDGAAWLRGLVDSDAAARAMLPPPRPGVPRTVEAPDGQLMGFRISPRMRLDLARAQLGARTSGCRPEGRAVVHPDEDAPGADRVFFLPASAPSDPRPSRP